MQPREGVDPGLVTRVTILVRPIAQCRMRLRESGKFPNALIQRVVRIEVVLGVSAVGAEQIVVAVFRDLAGKQLCRATWSPPEPVKPCSSP